MVVNKTSYKEVRDKCVAEFQRALNEVTPVDTPTPRWLLTLLIAPIFLWELTKLVWHFVVATVVLVLVCLLSIIAAPFMGLYLLIDTIMIMTWYFKRIIDKMLGEKE